MFKYRNKNTGQVVEFPTASARLEVLPNWETLVADGTPTPEPETVSPAVSDEDPATQDPEAPASPEETPPEPVVVVSEPEAPAEPEPVRPPKSATKDEWLAWAVSQGGEPELMASLTKSDLVELYG